jgi:hypothetical protein
MAAGFSTRRARHSLEIIAWQLFDSAFTHGSSSNGWQLVLTGNEGDLKLPVA